MATIENRAKSAAYSLSKAGIIQSLLKEIKRGKDEACYTEGRKKGINFRTVEDDIKIIAEAGAADFEMAAEDLGANYSSEILTTEKKITVYGNTLKLFFRGCQKIEEKYPKIFD